MDDVKSQMDTKTPPDGVKDEPNFSTAPQIVGHDKSHDYHSCRYCYPVYAMSVGVKSETTYLAGFQFCIDPNRLLPISLLYSDKADTERDLVDKLSALGMANSKFAPSHEFIIQWHNQRWVVDANTPIPPQMQGNAAVMDIHHNALGLGLVDMFRGLFAATLGKDPDVSILAKMACRNNRLQMGGNPAVALGAMYADYVRSNCNVTFDSLMYDGVENYAYADWD